MAESRLQLPSIHFKEGSNLKEWKDLPIQKLEVPDLERYIFAGPADTIEREQWMRGQAETMLSKMTISPDSNVLHEHIRRAILKISADGTADIVTKLGVVMALIDSFPPPDKLVASDGDKAQLRDACMRMSNLLELDYDWKWACSFLRAIRARHLEPGREPDAPQSNNITYRRFRPTATSGPGGWAFTAVNLGEALTARGPSGGRSPLSYRRGVSKVGVSSADSALATEANSLVWYSGRTLHGEADLREWWVRWINLRRNNRSTEQCTQAVISPLTPRPPLGPSSHFTRDDGMRLALNYYLRATVPLFSSRNYIPQQHVAVLTFASGLPLVEDGYMELHEAAYLVQVSAQLLDPFDPVTSTSYWHGGPFAGPGVYLLAATLAAIEEAIVSDTLTGALCILTFLYSICSTRHRKLYFDNRTGYSDSRVGEVNPSNPFAGLLHALNGPGSPGFALWEYHVDLNLQHIRDWIHGLPPSSAGYAIATNALGVGGAVYDLMRQLTRSYPGTSPTSLSSFPPLSSYYEMGPLRGSIAN